MQISIYIRCPVYHSNQPKSLANTSSQGSGFMFSFNSGPYSSNPGKKATFIPATRTAFKSSCEQQPSLLALDVAPESQLPSHKSREHISSLMCDYYLYAVAPPSTTILWPVTWSDTARNTTASAISSPVCSTPCGIRLRTMRS